MGFLTKKKILEADDLLVETVEVTQWGGTVRVRGMSGAERDKLDLWITERRNGETVSRLDNFRAKVLALTLVDEDGKLLFDESDIEALAKKSAIALEQVFNVASRLSGLTIGDLKEIEKNLSSGQSGGSGTA